MDWKKSLTQSRKDAKKTREASGLPSRRFEVEDLASNTIWTSIWPPSAWRKQEPLRITGAAQSPFVEADAQAGAVRYSTIGANEQNRAVASKNLTYTQTGAALSWEVDSWDRIRRKESARAEYLSTEEARRGVVVSLIGDVAGDYFTLRERDLELQELAAFVDLYRVLGGGWQKAGQRIPHRPTHWRKTCILLHGAS
jgi:outer membrane protein TolC